MNKPYIKGAEASKFEDFEEDELPPLHRFEKEPVRTSENQDLSVPVAPKKEIKPNERLAERIRQVTSIENLVQLLMNDPVSKLHDYVDSSAQIEKLNDYYRVHADSVIAGEMVSEKMSEKNKAAQGFAEIFQSINDPYNFGLKEKVKELLKVEMKVDFQNDSLNYAKKALDQVSTIEQLKRVAGYFSRLKAKNLNTKEPEFYDGAKVNQGIDNAYDYLKNLIQYQDLANKDNSVIEAEVSAALMSVPEDDLGIYQKSRELLLNFVLAQKPKVSPEQAQGNIVQRFGKRLSGFFSRK